MSVGFWLCLYIGEKFCFKDIFSHKIIVTFRFILLYLTVWCFLPQKKTRETVSLLPLYEKSSESINVAIYLLNSPSSVFCDLAVIFCIFVCGWLICIHYFCKTFMIENFFRKNNYFREILCRRYLTFGHFLRSGNKCNSASNQVYWIC